MPNSGRTNPFRPPTAAELFAPLSARLGLTTLEIHASPKWGSSQPDFRKNLHDALEARIKELGCILTSHSPYPVSAPANLKQASATIERSISISVSHAIDVGGFALLSSYEGVIGFDIESVGRVKDTVAKRICSENEKQPKDLSNDLFWVAKEASFKALRGPLQPPVISDVRLGAWQAIDETLGQISTSFNIKKPSNNQGFGLALTEKTHALAIFILLPST